MNRRINQEVIVNVELPYYARIEYDDNDRLDHCKYVKITESGIIEITKEYCHTDEELEYYLKKKGLHPSVEYFNSEAKSTEEEFESAKSEFIFYISEA